ncbi:MAG: amino acid adenylation domain-containing protein, partial [Burkholderiaceae bacterium]
MEVDSVAAAPMLGEAEREAPVGTRVAARSYPRGIALHEHFERQVQRTPEAVALSTSAGDGTRFELSYAELNRRANVIAHQLRDMGVAPNRLVGLRTERNGELMIGILAILKAGGAYLPLDPVYPKDRIAFMLEDAGVAIVLTQTGLQSSLAGTSATIICLDDPTLTTPDPASERNLPATSGADDLAYVIYTSGSTGQPKGVRITHHNVARLLAATEAWYAFNASDVWTLFHSYAFDFSVWEMWGALLYGGRLVTVSLETSRSTEAFRELLLRERVTVLNQTPTAFGQLIDADAAQPRAAFALRYVILGGESLELQSLKPWFDRYGDSVPRVINMYGITETTVHVTYRVITRADLVANAGSVIGVPIPDLRVYVLDANGEPAPLGVPGELYVAGAGVAPGYLNRPELTAQRFLPDPFDADPSARMYRSGDLVRRLANEDLAYLGRIDQQVKIRGFRIELGEIAAVMARHVEVRHVAVIDREDVPGDKRLAAYIVASNPRGDLIDELRQRLRAGLPEYMIPAHFVFVDSLPLTANGKLDRKALPVPSKAVSVSRHSVVTPRSPIEQAVWDIWRDALQQEHFGVFENFFELGGHSLLAMRVMSRLRQVLRIDFPLRNLFDTPTVAELARAAQDRLAIPKSTDAVAITRLTPDQREGLLPLSAGQQRMWFWQKLAPEAALYNVPIALALSGQLDAQLLQECLHALVQRHEALRCRWVEGDDQPMQRIESLHDWRMRHVVLDGADGAARYEQLAEQEAGRPFDLSREPAMRALLVTLDAQAHRLVWTLHHSVCDGWAVDVLMNELCRLYQDRCDGQAAGLPALALQFTDYAVWEPKWLADGVRERELGYWTQHLTDAPSSVDLPTDRRRPDLQRFRGATVPVEFSAAQLQALIQLTRRTGTTLFMGVLALWQALLYRYSGQATVVTGTVAANRDHPELEGVVGYFANTLALRCDFADALTVTELLAQVKATALAAYEHQHIPFEEVVEACKLPRDAGRTPLIQTFVVLQPPARAQRSMGDVQMKKIPLPSTVARFDLALELQELDTVLQGWLEYDTDLFERVTIERMVSHLHSLVNAMCADPTQPVAKLPLLGAAERALVVTVWNNTASPFPHHSSVHSLVERQAERIPRAMALRSGASALSYAELQARTHRLARHLRSLGIARGALVGLCVQRSVDMVVAQLAILECGAAYVPLDPSYPGERLAYMAQDAALALLVTESSLAGALDWPRAKSVWLDLDARAIAAQPAGDLEPSLALDARPEDPAYVIYTSGSTGKPKGVVVPHRAVVNFLTSMARE